MCIEQPLKASVVSSVGKPLTDKHFGKSKLSPPLEQTAARRHVKTPSLKRPSRSSHTQHIDSTTSTSTCDEESEPRQPSSTTSSCTTSPSSSTSSLRADLDLNNDNPACCENGGRKTTAILDWDDTICPSTHLASLGLRVDDPSALPTSLQKQLQLLESAVINIVQEALRFGKVVVITNAEAGWVELSGRRFLPKVVSFLTRHDIKIVSARTSFESDFPDAPSSWKMAAFSQEVGTMFPNDDELNVLVLGDSMSERDAAHALSSRLPNSKVKTVKFVERPSIDQLMRQVQLVAQSLPDLATYASSFDVDLVVSASA